MVQLERGVFILPSCAFFLCDEEGGFARRFFLWKMNGYSKYVCCISAPFVMNEYYLNQFFGSYKLFNLMCISIAWDNLVEMN